MVRKIVENEEGKNNSSLEQKWKHHVGCCGCCVAPAEEESSNIKNSRPRGFAGIPWDCGPSSYRFATPTTTLRPYVMSYRRLPGWR